LIPRELQAEENNVVDLIALFGCVIALPDFCLFRFFIVGDDVMMIISFVIEQIRKSSFARANSAHATRDLERYKITTLLVLVVLAVQ
jgi:hypothetical protein